MRKEETGQLKFAYEAIVKLENEVNKQREINLKLITALEGFVDSCYSGCTKEQLEELRIKAEKVLNSLK